MSRNVPRLFWYSLSVCMLATTATLCYVAMRSQSVDINVANTKISLSRAAGDVERLASQLDAKEAELAKARDAVAAAATRVPVIGSTMALPEVKPDPQVKERLRNNLQAVQKALKD